MTEDKAITLGCLWTLAVILAGSTAGIYGAFLLHPAVGWIALAIVCTPIAMLAGVLAFLKCTE